MVNEDPMYVATGGLVHLIGLAENTLCGMAQDGENGELTPLQVVPQKIGCDDCRAFIEYVKKVPNRYHRDRKRRARRG